MHPSPALPNNRQQTRLRRHFTKLPIDAATRVGSRRLPAARLDQWTQPLTSTQLPTNGVGPRSWQLTQRSAVG